MRRIITSCWALRSNSSKCVEKIVWSRSVAATWAFRSTLTSIRWASASTCTIWWKLKTWASTKSWSNFCKTRIRTGNMPTLTKSWPHSTSKTPRSGNTRTRHSWRSLASSMRRRKSKMRRIVVDRSRPLASHRSRAAESRHSRPLVSRQTRRPELNHSRPLASHRSSQVVSRHSSQTANLLKTPWIGDLSRWIEDLFRPKGRLTTESKTNEQHFSNDCTVYHSHLTFILID